MDVVLGVSVQLRRPRGGRWGRGGALPGTVSSARRRSRPPWSRGPF